VKKLLIIIILSASIFVGWYFISPPSESENEKTDEIAPESSVNGAEKTEPYIGRKNANFSRTEQVIRTDHQESTVNIASLRNHLNSFEGDFTDWGARNEDHAKWLKKHHYANGSEQYAAYTALSNNELEQLALAGDVIAKKQWALRLLYQYKDNEAGVQWMKEAAADGSIDAIHELSKLNQFGVGQVDDMTFPQNPIDALAWKKVAYILGDWEALSFNYPQYDSGSFEFLSEMVAANLYDELNEIHIKRYGTLIQRDTKPGLMEATETYLEFLADEKNQGTGN